MNGQQSYEKHPDPQSNRKHGLGATIKEGLSDMCYIWAKEMRSAFTDEGVLIFCILVPLFYPLLYSWIYNNEVVHEVPVAIVDMSHSQESRRFIQKFDASPDTKAAWFCNNLEEARDMVGKQQVHGVLYFPQDFATNLGRHEQSHVGVYCDMSLMLTYKAIYQTAQAVASDMNADIQIALSNNMTNRDDQITTQPLAFDEVRIFNPTGGYGNAIIPGVLMLILQQTLLLGIGLAAGTARENNRYKDLVPISKHYNGIFRIVLGKALCYFMVYAVMAAYITLCVPRFFHYTSIESSQTLLGLMVPYVLACIFFGMSLSCLVRYRENVILLVVFTSVPMLFMTGISWPLSNMPGIWQGVSMLFPSTWGVRGFLQTSSMGGTLGDITTEYQALWIQVVVYFFLTCLVYRYQIVSTREHALERIRTLRDKALQIKQQRKQTSKS